MEKRRGGGATLHHQLVVFIDTMGQRERERGGECGGGRGGCLKCVPRLIFAIGGTKPASESVVTRGVRVVFFCVYVNNGRNIIMEWQSETA